MGTRLLVMAAVLVAWMSPGNIALGHDGHGPGHEQKAEHRSSSRFSFGLSGSQVPGGGDPEGRAHATLALHPDDEMVCLRANWEGLAGEVTAIHVHKGPEGKSGPHHIEILNDESLAGQWNRAEFCVKVTGGAGQTHAHSAEGHHDQHEADAGGGSEAANRIRAVSDDPAGFYLNVHSTAFPNGAVRGQLAD